jgi:hypothetical protein
MSDELTPSERGMLELWRPLHPPADFAERVVAARAVRRRLAGALVAACAVACAAVAIVVLRPVGGVEPRVEVVLASVDAGVPAIAPVLEDAAAYHVFDAPLQPAPVAAGEADLVIPAGEAASIHDPRGKARVRVSFTHLCARDGTLEIARNARYAEPTGGSGDSFVDVDLDVGTWWYRVRCGAFTQASANGRLTVRKDRGTPLQATTPAVHTIAADGRTYRISYRDVIPDVRIEIGEVAALNLDRDGHEEVIVPLPPATSVIAHGKDLVDGTYTYWGSDPNKKSTLIIGPDLTAPQVFIDAPRIDSTWSTELAVRGAVLAGWSLMLDQISIPIVKGRFRTEVPRPGRVLVLRFEHPKRGIQYYLRHAQ